MLTYGLAALCVVLGYALWRTARMAGHIVAVNCELITLIEKHLDRLPLADQRTYKRLMGIDHDQ